MQASRPSDLDFPINKKITIGSLIVLSIGKGFTMAFAEQTVCAAEHGAILTVGFVVNNDRSACVFPMCNPSGTIDKVRWCADLVNSFDVSALEDLLGLISSDCQVTFLQADGMIDGYIPFREDSTSTENFGTRVAGTTPDQAAGLIAWYCDPADIAVGKKIRVAHNFIPGIPATDVVSNTVQTSWLSPALDFATIMQNGFPSSGLTGTWSRYLKAPKKPLNVVGTNVLRVSTAVIRGYVGTQRRRLLPHG